MKVQIESSPGIAVRQTEFSLAVPVCAWCKPKPGPASLTVISHGICPRHLRMMRAKLARQLNKSNG